ncbi:MAG: peptidoglycan bridge formation glycyltransferase FemA/FemB family protein [Elusimicrobia bacterium]|nr:peptidoglycan bridge formation glycyltransferase FemA/FemB family protein [Elusimicrobiota bacterium]
MSWKRFDGDDAAWDARIAGLPEASVFQSSSWARHKAASGWEALRLVRDGAAVQALVRRLPAGARLLWARGGPVGDPSAWDAGLRRELLRQAGGSAAYARVCPYRPADAAGEAALSAAGWRRPSRPLNPPTTYRLTLAAGPNPSANWAHNLRRGLGRCGPALPWDAPDPSEMERLYLALESYKGLAAQHRAASLASLVAGLGPRLIVRRIVVDGKTVAMRACGVFGPVAMDLLAAAAPEARKIYASYVLLAALLDEARRAGAQAYDLGGADPIAAKGVADFKKGTGARFVETLGEWDAAAPDFARGPVGALIAARMAS